MIAPEGSAVRSRPIYAVVPLARILAGQRHAPVVYFARMGFVQRSEVVKIGTSTDLQARMRRLYVPLGNVLALIPGGREVEAGYHRLFAEYQVNHRMREMFRLEGRLRRFLGSQTEGLSEDLPPCVPMLVRPAAHVARVAEVALPATEAAALSGPMSLLEIVRAFLLPEGTPKEQKNFTQALRQDRYRSDRDDLPGGLKFPEPVAEAAPGHAEKFTPLQVIEFNETRRRAMAA